MALRKRTIVVTWGVAGIAILAAAAMVLIVAASVEAPRTGDELPGCSSGPGSRPLARPSADSVVIRRCPPSQIGDDPRFFDQAEWRILSSSAMSAEITVRVAGAGVEPQAFARAGFTLPSTRTCRLLLRFSRAYVMDEAPPPLEHSEPRSHIALLLDIRGLNSTEHRDTAPWVWTAADAAPSTFWIGGKASDAELGLSLIGVPPAKYQALHQPVGTTIVGRTRQVFEGDRVWTGDEYTLGETRFRMQTFVARVYDGDPADLAEGRNRIAEEEEVQQGTLVWQLLLRVAPRPFRPVDGAKTLRH